MRTDHAADASGGMDDMVLVFEILITLLLLVGSIYDCKYYRLPVWLLLLAALTGAVSCLYARFAGRKETMEVVYCILPGMVSLLFSYATGEQLGYGDGILLLAVGGCFGLQKTMWVILIGIFGSFLASIFLILFRRAKKNRRLAFVPFLLCAAVMVMWGDGHI